MNIESAWEWAATLPSAPPGEVCAQCHDCRSLYEPIAERIMRVLELQRPWRPPAGAPSITPPTVEMARELLEAKLIRLKRISGLYAESFQALYRLNVRLPFAGTAAFTSNLVGWELEQQFATTLALHPDWSNPLQNQMVPRSPFGLGTAAGSLVRRPTFPVFWQTLQQVFDGNAVVFVEIFAIIDFFIRHLQRYGHPGPSELAQFETCLSAFIQWWDEVQPSNRKIPEMADIQVDRRGLILQGLMKSLRGEGLGGSLDILENEQHFTLQEYMYDLIDRGILDEMEIGLHSKSMLPLWYQVSSRFVYNPGDPEIPERYIVPYQGHGLINWTWITEYDDRIGYARQVVQRFDELFYGSESDRRYLSSGHARLAGDASGY